MAAKEKQVLALLELLGDDVADAVLSRLRPERAKQLRSQLAKGELDDEGADAAELLADFEKFFRFVVETGQSGPRLHQPDTESPVPAPAEETPSNSPVEEEQLPRFEASNDPIADLERVTIHQLAGAVAEEQPSTIALLLNRVSTARTAEVLGLLPEEIRSEVALELNRDRRLPEALLQQMARTAISRAAKLPANPTPKPDRIQRMADVLRAVDKTQRQEMLAAIEEHDPDSVASIMQRLYVFSDLADLPDRTLQKVLGQVETTTLATALSGADEQLIEKIEGNLSKRAREALRDERQLLVGLSESRIEKARSMIAQILATLDQEEESPSFSKGWRRQWTSSNSDADSDFGIEARVAELVEQLGLNQPIVVRLHPADVQLLQQRIGDLRAESDGQGLIRELGPQLLEIRRQWLESLDDAQTERRRPERVRVGAHEYLPAEVVGFDGDVSQIMSFFPTDGVRPGIDIVATGHRQRVPVGPDLLGRTLNGLGEPIDGLPLPMIRHWRTVNDDAPAPLERHRIEQPLVTGQRVIDGLLTCGYGQRIGLFAGSGVGKSTLLGEIAREARADLNVVVLVGERGREVRPFLEDCLGPEGLARSVVIVATSDELPLMRIRAVTTGITIAEAFRDNGANVLFLLDSVTRLATAQRELGLLRGEPPGTRGYPPSVQALMANTLERLGTAEQGSITGIITVLVDGDDMDEPIADAARSILDGHIVLSRKLAAQGHFPSVDVLHSVSRLFRDVTDSDHQQAATKLRSMLATYADVADLLQIGAYKQGSSPRIDRMLELRPAVEAFLRQDVASTCTFEETRKSLMTIADAWPF
ncbi:Flagellum-specific ATP synthase [Durusdinium trenchii]|uniref:Flagellum-specific ATP synthase n=1 Tax=Durusdinium trenchii TaxID=1381693 RepID=A0ABP0JJE9_9DINO